MLLAYDLFVYVDSVLRVAIKDAIAECPRCRCNAFFRLGCGPTYVCVACGNETRRDVLVEQIVMRVGGTRLDDREDLLVD